MANNGVYLGTTNNRGSATHLRDPLPNGVTLTTAFIGGRHNTIDGGRAFDWVAAKTNFALAWSSMSLSEFNALYNLVFGGTLLYLWLPDSAAQAYAVIFRGSLGRTFHYRPDGTIVYDSVSVLLEEA